MGTRTINTVPVLSAVRIEPSPIAGQDPRVWVEGQVQDDQGRVVETVQKNVYPDLTAAQKTAVVARAAGD